LTQVRTALDTRVPSADPHVTIAIPFAQVDRELAPAIEKEKAQRLRPIAAIPSLFVDAKVRTGRVIVTDGDNAGVELVVDIGQDAVQWVSLTMVVRLRPQVVDGAAVLRVMADDLREVKPRFGADARDKLKEALRSALPAALAPADGFVVGVADELLAFLGGEGFRLIREELLPRVLKLTEVSVELPDVPVGSVDVRAADAPHPQMMIALGSDLPVRKGVVNRAAAGANSITVRMSGSTAAELANWAMVQRLIPPTYNSDFEPDDQGTLEPRLDWRPGDPHPLRIHVFATEPTCVRVIVAAAWRLSVRDGDIVSEVTEGEMVEVDGAWPVVAGLWLSRLGAEPLRFAQKHTASLRLTLAGRQRLVVLEDAAVLHDEVQVVLALSP
jgi:hypothetical protein